VVTVLDGCDGSGRFAGVAHERRETSGLILGQNGVRTLASVAGNVLDDILLEQRLDMLGVETTLQDHLTITGDGTFGTKLSAEEFEDVLDRSVHDLAGFLGVGPTDLLGTDTDNLRGNHLKFMGFAGGQLRVVCRDDLLEALQKGFIPVLRAFLETGIEFLVIADGLLRLLGLLLLFTEIDNVFFSHD